MSFSTNRSSYRPVVCALAGALVLALGLLAAAPAAAQPPQIIASTTSQVGPLVRTEATVQVGADPLDRFQMIRLAKANAPLRGALLFLPPLGTNFSFYEQRDESGAFGSSIAEFFALRNFDVYGYSQRYEGLTAGSCEAGVIDCSAMAGWDIQSHVDDVAFVRAWIEGLNPGVEVVAGGNSLGAILALAVADAAPADYAGLLVWEGMLTSADPAVIGLNQGYCAVLEAQLAGGLLYDGIGNQVIKKVAQEAVVAPGAPTPIRLFPPFLTSQQVLVGSLSVPNPGPFTMPTPGYILLAGDPVAAEFTYASQARLTTSVLTGFNDYVPLPVVRDISCSLAGTETAYTDGLGAYTGKALFIGGGQAFGAYMGDQIAELSSADVTFLLEPDFGHVDHFMTPRHRRYVELPILRWLRSVF